MLVEEFMLLANKEVAKRALHVGAMARVDFAQEIQAQAREALVRDSTAGGAHHVLGEWHAEIRRLNGLARFAAERLLGAEVFGEASWEAAAHHLERAVELEPEAIVHRVALARVYLDVGRPSDARRELELAVALPVVEPTDPKAQRRARGLLDGIEP